jgi:hypothetical protein
MGVTAVVNWRLKHDFAREFAESLRRGGDDRPLGEIEIAAMLADGESSRDPP